MATKKCRARADRTPNPTFDVISLRQSLKMTQDQFADYAGVSKRTIRRWEREGHRPRGYHVRRLAKLKVELKQAASAS